MILLKFSNILYIIRAESTHIHYELALADCWVLAFCVVVTLVENEERLL